MSTIKKGDGFECLSLQLSLREKYSGTFIGHDSITKQTPMKEEETMNRGYRITDQISWNFSGINDRSDLDALGRAINKV